MSELVTPNRQNLKQVFADQFEGMTLEPQEWSQSPVLPRTQRAYEKWWEVLADYRAVHAIKLRRGVELAHRFTFDPASGRPGRPGCIHQPG